MFSTYVVNYYILSLSAYKGHFCLLNMESNRPGEVKLARTLGLGSIVLLGVGALLGGGIFTLLGPAAGLAGPGLFLAMILGRRVAFLNLQMYIALGTTFPEAG